MDRQMPPPSDDLVEAIARLLEEKCESKSMDDPLDRLETAAVVAEWIRNQEEMRKSPMGPWVSPPNGFWRTREGKLIPIEEMSDRHLRNCLKLVQKKAIERAADQTVEAVMSSDMTDPASFPRWQDIASKWSWWQAMINEARQRGLDIETFLENEGYIEHMQMAQEAVLLAEKESSVFRSANREPHVFWHKDPEQRKYMGGQLCFDCYNHLFSRSQRGHEGSALAREDYEPVPSNKRTPYPYCECQVPIDSDDF